MTTIELFAGAGGLALGLEKAGFKHLLLNEIDKNACLTLKTNRPNWNVLNEDINKVSFKEYKDKVDLLTGGIPCQAFSYAGKRLGFKETRGTLFFEFARTLVETNSKMFLIENVKGLFTHDKGRTIETMLNILEEIGYYVYKPTILDASLFNVPQKRERLFIIGIRKDLKENTGFEFPEENKEPCLLKEALFKGKLYDTDVPLSVGSIYPKSKIDILSKVPEGGNWKNLSEELQRTYMGGAFFSGGGKTGIARRTTYNKPCPTLLCSPAQKQTERCHPIETRPFQIREYARIQTFPDNWIFQGSLSSQYRQIGNAVPVNLAYEIGKQLIKTLNFKI